MLGLWDAQLGEECADTRAILTVKCVPIDNTEGMATVSGFGFRAIESDRSLHESVGFISRERGVDRIEQTGIGFSPALIEVQRLSEGCECRRTETGKEDFPRVRLLSKDLDISRNIFFCYEFSSECLGKFKEKRLWREKIITSYLFVGLEFRLCDRRDEQRKIFMIDLAIDRRQCYGAVSPQELVDNALIDGEYAIQRASSRFFKKEIDLLRALVEVKKIVCIPQSKIVRELTKRWGRGFAIRSDFPVDVVDIEHIKGENISTIDLDEYERSRKSSRRTNLVPILIEHEVSHRLCIAEGVEYLIEMIQNHRK